MQRRVGVRVALQYLINDCLQGLAVAFGCPGGECPVLLQSFNGQGRFLRKRENSEVGYNMAAWSVERLGFLIPPDHQFLEKSQTLAVEIARAPEFEIARIVRWPHIGLRVVEKIKFFLQPGLNRGSDDPAEKNNPDCP